MVSFKGNKDRRRSSSRWLRRVSIAIALVVLGTVLAIGVLWGTRRSWGPGMIVVALSPRYAPVQPPDEVSRVVEVKRPDARIRAWLFEPESRPRGTVILLHGIHDSKKTLLPGALHRARRGFRALAVDLRGHGESSGRWLTYGVRESEDLSALIDRLQQLDLLQRPLGVHGTSYGAATALMLGGSDSRVDSIVAVAPFSSLPEVVPYYARWMFGSAAELIPAFFLRDILDDAGRRAGFDPGRACPRCAVSGFRGSLLLVHGKAEERIPWQQSVQIRDAATRASEVRVVLVPGASHLGVGSAKGVPALIDRWFDEQLVSRGNPRGAVYTVQTLGHS